MTITKGKQTKREGSKAMKVNKPKLKTKSVRMSEEFYDEFGEFASRESMSESALMRIGMKLVMSVKTNNPDCDLSRFAMAPIQIVIILILATALLLCVGAYVMSAIG